MIRTLIAALIVAATVSVPLASAEVDPVNRGPLNVFRRDSVTCRGGWKFTGLIWGDRPVSACMYKPKKKNVFGGSF
jgi:hypothetical protein